MKRHFLFLVFVILSILMVSSLVAIAYEEAPQLKELVEKGELPPVEERLPEEPLVVSVRDSIGKYGGDWRMAFAGGHGIHPMPRVGGYENLVNFNPEWNGVVPNIAKSWEVNEDATEYTFYLRKGMKWSDGVPFTADDILFWFEDIALNEELSPGGPPSWMKIGGKVGTVEKINDYTVKFKFPQTHGLLLYRLAAGTNPVCRNPKHYYKQFHPKYTDQEKIDKLIEEAGVSTWVDLFELKGGIGGYESRFRNDELPQLWPWIVTKAPGEATQRAIMERNPYYWKVDPEGNQLPYIDRLVFDILGDKEVLLMKAMNGEIDMQDQFLNDPSNKSVLADNRERGNYKFFETTPTAPNTFNIMLNLNHPDPVKREIFQNKDFRIGLSHAINRQEIIDLVLVGQSEPHQTAPRPESKFYDEELAKQYTEFDVDLANEYLDRAGYAEKDSEGFRLGPDGKRIKFTMELDQNRPMYPEIGELVCKYWRNVGIDAQLKTEDRSIWEVHVRQNFEYDVTAHRFGGGAGIQVLLDPRYFFPSNWGSSAYAGRWTRWYLAPSDKIAEEPPAIVKKQMDLYDQLKDTADQKEQEELMKQILEITKEQFYTIGICLEPSRFGIVKNNMKNVPESMPFSWDYPHPGPTNPETYYWDK